MKQMKYVLSFLIIFFFLHSKAQLQLSGHVGYDVPFFNNNTPSINYKGGLSTGGSIDYYFSKWGIGADVDFIKNKPQNTLPTSGLVNPLGVPISNYLLVEKEINRNFYGIGPSYKFQSAASKWQLEVQLRAGLGSVKGGYTSYKENTTVPGDLLNFHAGYNATNAFSAKAQIKGSYFFSNTFGIQAGVYYLQHFGVPELVDPVYAISAKYQPVVTSGNVTTYNGGYNIRTASCNCGVSSVGAFVGLVIKTGKNKKLKPEECEPEYGLVVTAKDKITGNIIPNTVVTINAKDGIHNKSGITNSYGVVVFEGIKPFDYEIAGSVAETALEGNKAMTNEFEIQKVVQKTILYTSSNFIINGKVLECNGSKTIAGINVVLENGKGIQQTTITSADGSFMLPMPQSGLFTLYGKKGNYFSQVEEIDAVQNDRNKNLFITLEICSQQIECGKAILLKNIQYDLDKYFIRPDAKPELNKLVRFMKDNPAVSVELRSHTDSRASAAYNITLSQNRANAAVDYLVAMGISRNRLIPKGYGESVLLNNCADGVNCSEAEHAISRRTEMKVICPNQQ